MPNCVVHKNCSACRIKNDPPQILANTRAETVLLLNTGRLSRFFQRGEEIYRQGQSLAGLYCISSARVKLVSNDRLGKAQILGLAGPGEILGLTGLFNGEAPHSAIALTAGVVCCFARESLTSALEQDPALVLNLLSSLAKHNVILEERLQFLAGQSAAARVAKTLVTLADSGGQVQSFTRTEIAQLSGTSLETASRLVQQWARQGLIGLQARKIQLHHIGYLHKLVVKG